MVSWKEEEREYFAFCQKFAFGFALLVNLLWSFNKGVNFEAVKVADGEDCFKTRVQMSKPDVSLTKTLQYNMSGVPQIDNK